MSQKYKGRVISVVAEKRTLPNGNTVVIDLVRHPGAVVIVPLLRSDEIILIRQYRPVLRSYMYELPAGTLKAGEQPLSCAKRELLEETGYAACHFEKLGKIFPVHGYSTEVMTIFKAEGLLKREAQLEEDEVITICLFKKSKVRQLFRSGAITDAKTICGLTFLGWIG